MSSKRNKVRKIILFSISILILVEILVLTPSPLEDPKNSAGGIEPVKLVEDNGSSVIPDLPKGRIPDYSIINFRYVSVQNGNKQWKLDAENAFMYNPDKLVHARTIKATVFDPDNKVTLITGSEAKYFLNQKDLEVFGNVHTIMPDGFEIWSDYLRFRPNEHRMIIPSKYFVHGDGTEEDGQNFTFSSMGFDYRLQESLVTLPQQAKVTLIKTQVINTEGVPSTTVVESDHCLMNRKTKMAYFRMNPSRPLNSRFVHITQPNLFTKARQADLNYGDFSQILEYLVARDDVLIQEADPDTHSLRYATGGKADFDTRRDTIKLTQFPQVYQNLDTVTGDLVLFHRDTGIIEIEQSNGFSQGTE